MCKKEEGMGHPCTLLDELGKFLHAQRLIGVAMIETETVVVGRIKMN